MRIVAAIHVFKSAASRRPWPRIILSAAGVVALAGLITSRRRSTGVPKGFAVSALILAVASAAAMGYTANLGGMIRHTEIRPDAGAGVEAGGGAAPDGVTRDEGP